MTNSSLFETVNYKGSLKSEELLKGISSVKRDDILIKESSDIKDELFFENKITCEPNNGAFIRKINDTSYLKINEFDIEDKSPNYRKHVELKGKIIQILDDEKTFLCLLTDAKANIEKELFFNFDEADDVSKITIGRKVIFELGKESRMGSLVNFYKLYFMDNDVFSKSHIEKINNLVEQFLK